MSAQRFEILTATAAGERVVLELAWTGTPAVPLGSPTVGGEMRTRFAFVIESRNGKVRWTRNQDCFDPWWPGLSSSESACP
jgi:hypothetical protein